MRSLLAGGGSPAKRLLEFGTQVAEVQAAAHEKGIVHRDLKPEKVVVTITLLMEEQRAALGVGAVPTWSRGWRMTADEAMDFAR